jgi:hypothetical protein
MYKPRDLTDPKWQASVTDEELLTVIQKGKEKMPGFSLPDTVAHNLVKLVRLLNADRLRGAATGQSGKPTTPAADDGAGGSPNAPHEPAADDGVGGSANAPSEPPATGEAQP